MLQICFLCSRENCMLPSWVTRWPISWALVKRCVGPLRVFREDRSIGLSDVHFLLLFFLDIRSVYGVDCHLHPKHFHVSRRHSHWSHQRLAFNTGPSRGIMLSLLISFSCSLFFFFSYINSYCFSADVRPPLCSLCSWAPHRRFVLRFRTSIFSIAKVYSFAQPSSLCWFRYYLLMLRSWWHRLIRFSLFLLRGFIQCFLLTLLWSTTCWKRRAPE